MYIAGRHLSAVERAYFLPYFKKSTLESALIFEGKVPFWLRSSMCAVVIGHRIYFRLGVYDISTLSGIELLAHELIHVEQYLAGMTLLKYCWASRYGYKKNPYEIEAYVKAKIVRQQLEKSLVKF